MPDLKIAAVYIRVSTDDQTELSPDSQLSVVRDYAAKNGYIIPDEYIFVDDGISGRQASKRPAFNQMIATAKEASHPFDTILVWKFSRFARNQEESIVYKAMLRKDHIDVVSISEPLAEGPFGSLIERILEWMDEYYSIRLSGEVKRSMTLNAQRGKRQIAPPFGYRLTPADENEHRLMVPEPEEAALVREMFTRFASGEGQSAIARWANTRGARTHRGNPFENRTVEYILMNPVYIGKMRWTPTGRTRRDFHNPDTLIVDADHEPLIDAALWQSVQERMRAVKEQWGYKARPTYELKDWLGGVVRCGECGSTLIFSKPHFFKCNNYVRGRCHSTQHVHVDKLHEAVIDRLKEDLHSSTPLSIDISHISDQSGEDLKRLSAALDALDRRQARVREAYAAGIDTLEDYAGYRKEIAAERERLQAAIADLQHRIDPDAAQKQLRRDLAEALKTLENPSASKEEKNNTFRGIVESCIFDRSTALLKMTYRVSV